jgi:hypothetical protein
LGLAVDKAIPEQASPENEVGAFADHAQPVCIHDEAGRRPEEEYLVA